MLAIREIIEKNRGKAIETTDNISILETHFEEAIQLVLKQNAMKK